MINFGHKGGAHIPDSLRTEALLCQERLNRVGASLSQAVDYYLAEHDIRSKSVTVKEACATFRRELERRVANREVTSLHLENLAKAMRKLEASFSDSKICDLSALTLRNALNEMPLASASKNHYRIHWSVLFSYAEDQGWIKENPIADVKSFRDKRAKLPGIFSVHEAAKLLESAVHPELVPVIALGLFAGIRPEEIRRLDWEDILWEKKLINVRSDKSKTAEPRWVTMSDNLLEWLLPYRRSSGGIEPVKAAAHYHVMTQTRKAAGLTQWPKDGLRHSFGSYHLALHENAPLTAKEMGHMKTNMLYKHYNHRVMKEQAQAYFAIRPLTADKVVAIAL